MTTQQAESRTRETIPRLILRTQSTILHKTSSLHMNVMAAFMAMASSTEQDS